MRRDRDITWRRHIVRFTFAVLLNNRRHLFATERGFRLARVSLLRSTARRFAESSIPLTPDNVASTAEAIIGFHAIVDRRHA